MASSSSATSEGKTSLITQGHFNALLTLARWKVSGDSVSAPEDAVDVNKWWTMASSSDMHAVNAARDTIGDFVFCDFKHAVRAFPAAATLSPRVKEMKDASGRSCRLEIHGRRGSGLLVRAKSECFILTASALWPTENGEKKKDSFAVFTVNAIPISVKLERKPKFTGGADSWALVGIYSSYLSRLDEEKIDAIDLTTLPMLQSPNIPEERLLIYHWPILTGLYEFAAPLRRTHLHYNEWSYRRLCTIGRFLDAPNTNNRFTFECNSWAGTLGAPIYSTEQGLVGIQCGTVGESVGGVFSINRGVHIREVLHSISSTLPPSVESSSPSLSSLSPPLEEKKSAAAITFHSSSPPVSSSSDDARSLTLCSSSISSSS